jgi:dihydroorotate dehydrogenase (fumarate)
MPDLSVEYMGLQLRNPLIVASSGLTRNAGLVRQCEQAGVGAVVMKSIFEEDIRRKDNTFDDFLSSHPEASEYFRADVGLVYGAQQYCEEIRQAKKETGIPVIASVNCSEPRWWVDYASQLAVAGADAIEINLSVPSVELELSSEQAENNFSEIVSAVVSRVKIPVAVKMSGQLTSPQNTAKKLVDAGAGALVTFNRQSGLDISLNSRKAFSSKGDQGLTTSQQIYYPLRWVTILHELMPDVQLSASGGVHSGEAFVKYLLAGATTVQVCSLFYREGLKQAAVLLDSLSAYMQRVGADNVSQIRGSVARDIMIGSRDQQRLEYLQLSKGHYLEVDSTDGGGLMYESHNSHEE